MSKMPLVNNVSTLRKNLHRSYDNGEARRIHVPLEKMSWSEPYSGYSPPSYTLPVILSGSMSWADPELNDPDFDPNWNGVDEATKLNRESLVEPYDLVPGFGPLNPVGRTGLRGRGRLGRWGPNHAVDPVVTRFKTVDGKIAKDAKDLPYLQFIGIQRKDTKEWALPGGMVDAGEDYTVALLREFMEEVFNSEEMADEEAERLKVSLKGLFENGEDVYKGYVDDPRNTDNAWIETHAVNVHLPEESEFHDLPFKAGSDALNAKWIDFTSRTPLYANHKDFLKTVAEKLNTHR